MNGNARGFPLRTLRLCVCVFFPLQIIHFVPSLENFPSFVEVGTVHLNGATRQTPEADVTVIASPPPVMRPIPVQHHVLACHDICSHPSLPPDISPKTLRRTLRGERGEDDDFSPCRLIDKTSPFQLSVSHTLSSGSSNFSPFPFVFFF